jgi:U3 small nucleolar RNA-associated protein 12
MVKSYLRYAEGACLGLVCSAGSNVEFDRKGDYAIAAALSNIILWNLRTGARYKTLGDRQLRAEVTALRRSPDGKSIGAGYSDGSVRIWTISDGECFVTFHGHKKGVTTLAFNRDGTMLASGSKDTDVVVWDVVAEAGRCRLQGHKDAVTDLRFIEDQDRPMVLTTSKDTLAKLWELDTHHCVQTLVGHRSELWSLAATEDGSRIVTAGGDSELRVWGWRVAEPEPEPELSDAGEPVSKEVGAVRVLHCLGTLQRASRARVVTCRFDTCGAGVLVVQSSDKSVEVFRTRGVHEVAKKLKRKEKRKREKAKRKAEAAGGAPDAELSAGEEESTDTGLAMPKPAQEFEQVVVLRADSKVRSIALSPKLKKGSSTDGGSDALTLLMALANNRLEVHEVNIDPKVPVQGRAIKKSGVYLPGHRSGALPLHSFALSLICSRSLSSYSASTDPTQISGHCA